MPASSEIPGYPDPDTLADLRLLRTKGTSIPDNPMALFANRYLQTLISDYEAQQARDQSDGYMLEARTIAPGAGITLSSAAVGAGRTVTADVAAFSPSDVGQQVLAAGGLATITAYTSATVVTATVVIAFGSTAYVANAWQLSRSPQVSITASATDPTADADAAAQLIYPFGNIGNIDPIPQEVLEKKQWYRGHSVGLRARQTNTDFIRLAETVAQFGVNGSQDQDPLLGYGIDAGLVMLDVQLDGDVFFLRTQGNNGCTFALFVDGSRVTIAPGSGVTQELGTRYYPTAKFVKLKWNSVKRRRLQIVFCHLHCPTIFYTRQTSTLLPTNPKPLGWLHFGDSFSQYTGASSREMGLIGWLHAAFGYGFDFVNIAQGATAFASGTRPGETPVATVKPSLRNQYLLHGQKNKVAVATYLIGHNDSSNDYTILASELIQTLNQVALDNPGVVQVVFTSNASPGIISNNTVVPVENAIVAAASSVPGVLVVRMQAGDEGPFLRGTGNVSAQNGSGNADLYVSADGAHPSGPGHKGYGTTMANKMYSALLKATL